MTIGLLLAAVLVAACVVYVAMPYLRDPDPVSDRLEELDGRGARLVQLAEERDRAFEALRELEEDHRSGRIAEADYRAQVGRLRRESADALQALDREHAATREG